MSEKTRVFSNPARPWTPGPPKQSPTGDNTMNEEKYKQWVCKLSGYDYQRVEHLPYWRQVESDILLKAMFAINRDKNIDVCMSCNTNNVFTVYFGTEFNDVGVEKFGEDHNNSEKQSLDAALKEIFKQIGGNKDVS